MIAERDTGRTVTSTLAAGGAERVAMGIDANAMAHIMNVLTDLYSDPEYAVIREYSTNAYDAHIEAGVTRPIEVATPSTLSPFLRIKDHGVGLTAEDIRSIYSQYGNSTKRNTNDQVGMLGLGCKSALTYSDQFSVASVKDGRRITVSIERDSEGAGVMQIVSDEPTDDPNGTEVIIPCKARNNIHAEAERFFSYWQPGTVLLNGVEPKRVEGLAVGENMIVVLDDDYANGPDIIVMGNVPYPVESPLSIDHGLPNGYRNKSHLVVWVGIGEVNFPPSRESLMDTKTTRATLRRVEDEFKRNLGKAVQESIEQAPTARDAVQNYVRWKTVLGRSLAAENFTYKGASLPTSFVPAAPVDPGTQYHTMFTGSTRYKDRVGLFLTANSDYKLSRAEAMDALPVGSWDGTLFLYGYTFKGVSAAQKRKMLKYVEDNGLTGYKNFALVNSKPNAQQTRFIGAQHIKPWADVQAIKLPSAKAATASGRLPGSYDCYVNGQWKSGLAGTDIDTSYPVFWLHGNLSAGRRWANLLTKYHPNNTVVCLAENRIEKFCRILPNSLNVRDAVKALWTAYTANKLTDEDKLALHIQNHRDSRMLAALDPSQIEDPDFKRAVTLAQADVSAHQRARQEFASLVNVEELASVKWESPLKKYPLYGSDRYGYGRVHPDIYFYINAKYQASITNTKEG